MITRRAFLRGTGAAAASGLLLRSPLARAAPAAVAIDRRALVSRHDVERTASDPSLPLQVGNGSIAFGADVTGLQTFLPFAIMSHWGWHEDPLPAGQTPSDYAGTAWDTHGRPVRYWTGDAAHPELNQWLRENPHRINLGRIGLQLRAADGRDATESDLSGRRQRLELWTGTLHSALTLDGEPVSVQTTCHPELDAIAVRIESPLIRAGRLAVFVDFPYGPAQDKFSAPFVGVWDQPDAHVTELEQQGPTQATITHSFRATRYEAALRWHPDGRLARGAGHRYVLTPGDGERIELSCLFSPTPRQAAPPAAAVAAASAAWWPRLWSSGGAVDLSGSADPRWPELERRAVLSQYYMSANEAGSFPPQESGLVNNGWYGKFHMEMYWWHAAHHALWNRWALLDRSLDVYQRFLPSARERARDQGFRGARWPKMTSPIGRESPGLQNALLLWQQPHPIFFAELDYRAHPRRATLERWSEVVFATADFLASYAFFDGRRYVIGPPMIVAAETNPPAETTNPTFELSYWRFGLRVAQQWRERLGLTRDPGWDDVLARLAPLPVQDGRYVLYDGVQNMWTKYSQDHPDPIAPYGMLPGDGVDVPTMRATAQQVYAVWPLDDLYSWDFPLLAMNAARLGDPARAVDFLLHDRFRFDATGLAASGKSGVPSPYFPGAGGLLYALAMMCAGWDGAPGGDAPGFPPGWRVAWDGLSPAI